MSRSFVTTTLRATVVAFAMGAPALINVAAAQAQEAVQPGETVLQSGSFENLGYDARGTWSIVERADGGRELRFSDDFRTRGGPDLKVFISPETTSTITGENATTGAVRLGELGRSRGGKTFDIPADVDLAAFGSFVVHCERFAKLWNGADLNV